MRPRPLNKITKGGFMKNFIKTLIIVSAFLSIGCMQVFATNISNEITTQVNTTNNITDLADYQEKAKGIRAEINALSEQIKELRTYNSSVNAKLKALNEKYKTDKSVISSDTMKQIKELRKSIKSVEAEEKTVTEESTIKALVQNKEYDKALAKLNETLENKKARLKTLQGRNAIWRQIDALIG